MQEEADRNVPFALALGRMLPHLKIHTLDIKGIGPNTYTINLVVDNCGFLPTYTSNQGKKQGVMRSVRVELEIPEGVELLNGRQKEEIGHLEGRSNKIGSIFSVASPTDNRGRLEWTLKGSQGTKLEIHIMSERAGTIRQEVILE